MANRSGGFFRRIWQAIRGEISQLRTIGTGGTGATYVLNSSRVDYALARDLYDNAADNYKLAGGFCRPVINTAVGFMGVPRFVSEDPAAQDTLDRIFGGWTLRMQMVHRDAMKLGDSWVWITRVQDPGEAVLYPETEGIQYVLTVIPPDMVTEIQDPSTGALSAVILISEQKWINPADGKEKSYTLKQTITREQITTAVVKGDRPPELVTGTFPNQWGFIPMVHFINEPDAGSINGRSDLEPIEPYLKAYHDVLQFGIQSHKMTSTPRMKLKLADIEQFLQNNFGITQEEIAAGTAQITLEGKELLLLNAGTGNGDGGEDAVFIEPANPAGATETLLKFLFYLIVDTSETPEFVFGTHIKSSNASVTEQLTPLLRKIQRKREMFTDAWQRVVRMVLAMSAMAEAQTYSTYAVNVVWDEVNPKSDREVADVINTLVQAFAVAVKAGIMGLESAVQFLRRYVDTMADYQSEDAAAASERDRIVETALLLQRIADGTIGEGEDQRALEEVKSKLRLAAGLAA